ncbi:MAG: NFACT RNA binding domain-containing protein [Candidatus Zixiibacteriota bacterium]
MQTALHIYSLVNELRDRLSSAVLIESEFYKKEREAYLHFKTEKGIYLLGLVYHPVSFGTFIIPRGKVNLTTSEKPWPFFQIAYNSSVTNISQIGLDRLIQIELQSNEDRFRIVIEALGPNGNFWLTDSENIIIATLRNREFSTSESYQPPQPLDKLNPFDFDLKDLISIFRRSDQYLENVIKKSFLGLDKNIINEIMIRAEIEPDTNASELTDNEIEMVKTQIKALSKMFDDYDRGYIFQTENGNFAYPFKLRLLGSEFGRAKSLSLAVYEAIRTQKTIKKEVDSKQIIIESVVRHIKKLKKKQSKIEDDLNDAANFEQFKKTAELLKINLHSIKKGQDKIEVSDLYTDGSPMIEIKLDPALTPAENADRYYKKYKKGREGLELLKRRSEIVNGEIETAESMQSELNSDFENANEKFESEIAAILPISSTSKTITIRLPYRPAQLSTGLTIFIGRDGADNDETTFKHAKPYELWFHASQCPGSHVVIKFPSKNFEPSKIEIAETAAIAAYHSKARNSKHVPVIYAERKYVRKPRGAKPGLVTVERETMIMVEPKKES